MKHLKTFNESTNKKLQVGDYIIAHLINTNPIQEIYNIDYFLLNTPGEILEVNDREVYVRYIIDKIIPRGGSAWEFRQWFKKIDKTKLYITLSLDKIDKIFKNKEDVETYLTTKKYNI